MILNIGHMLGNSGQMLTLSEIVQATERAGLGIKSVAVHHGTEPTSVVTLSSWPVEGLGDTIHTLAAVLGQDCIATWDDYLGVGGLIGPGAAAWGGFNPEFFLLPDGTPLSDSLPVLHVAA